MFLMFDQLSKERHYAICLYHSRDASGEGERTDSRLVQLDPFVRLGID